MASPKILTDTWEVPCQLLSTPTSLEGDYPYGATELGRADGIVVRTLVESYRITQTHQGQNAVAAYNTKFEVSVAARLVDWDTDALSAVMPGLVTASMGRPYVLMNKETGVRSDIAGQTFSLLVCPEIDRDRLPHFLMPAAWPNLDESFEMSLQLREIAGWPVVLESMHAGVGGNAPRFFYKGQLTGAGTPV